MDDTAAPRPVALADIVAACLADAGIGVEREVEDDGLVSLRHGVQARTGRWITYARCDEASRQVVVYAVFPVDAPPERRAAMAECLHRANRGLTVGNFEIDLDDGEILLKTSLDLGEAALTPALARALLDANTEVMAIYFPALMDVLYGGLEPRAALAKVEVA